MAKNKSEVLDEQVEEEVTETVVIKPVEPPQPHITFDLWFQSTGRAKHHKAGMKAFADTQGRRTKTSWDKLFEKY